MHVWKRRHGPFYLYYYCVLIMQGVSNSWSTSHSSAKEHPAAGCASRFHSRLMSITDLALFSFSFSCICLVSLSFLSWTVKLVSLNAVHLSSLLLVPKVDSSAPGQAQWCGGGGGAASHQPHTAVTSCWDKCLCGLQFQSFLHGSTPLLLLGLSQIQSFPFQMLFS